MAEFYCARVADAICFFGGRVRRDGDVFGDSADWGLAAAFLRAFEALFGVNFGKDV